jgi:hypothetical protein
LSCCLLLSCCYSSDPDEFRTRVDKLLDDKQLKRPAANPDGASPKAAPQPIPRTSSYTMNKVCMLYTPSSLSDPKLSCRPRRRKDKFSCCSHFSQVRQEINSLLIIFLTISDNFDDCMLTFIDLKVCLNFFFVVVGSGDWWGGGALLCILVCYNFYGHICVCF